MTWVIARCLFTNGDRLVIRGAVGAGKSVFLRSLAYAQLKPAIAATTEKGHVSILSPAVLVPPKPFLFAGSVLENIRLGRDTTADDIAQLASALALDKLLASLPAGLATRVRSDDSGISNGQAQAIGLLRALLLDPRVLLLDEATSNLDRETEAQFLEALRLHCPLLTVIVASHRSLLPSWSNGEYLVEDGAVIDGQRQKVDGG